MLRAAYPFITTVPLTLYVIHLPMYYTLSLYKKSLIKLLGSPDFTCGFEILFPFLRVRYILAGTFSILDL